jgi:hypothetical protein
MKINYFKPQILLTVFTATLFLVGPYQVFSASIFSSSIDAISAGDTAVINVFVNTEGETINSIDGSIVLLDENRGNFEVKDLVVVDSAFVFWTRKPSLESKQEIFFSGGTPNGIKGERLLVFKIIVKINQPGKFTIKSKNLNVYLNDGLVTSKEIKKSESVISVSEMASEAQDNWEKIISNDNTPPKPFEIFLGQDPSLYEGMKFVTFNAEDAESGIAYYQIKEGDYEYVRTGTVYVLRDQNKIRNITVKAYDKAGNIQTSSLDLGKSGINWKAIGFVLIPVLLIFYRKKISKLFRKNGNKN